MPIACKLRLKTIYIIRTLFISIQKNSQEYLVLKKETRSQMIPSYQKRQNRDVELSGYQAN
ncbi:MAG: hypothetical protein D3924_00710 [Candidatus Electrothrix sp. AR4]|nr:hypothetical protein [Candidatus Electrothrix sp. AR4]